MRVLLVKLSSLGDVIHNLPVVSDILRARPDIEIDWVTEAPYAELLTLQPNIGQVFPVHLRDLKKRWWSPQAWSGLSRDKARLSAQHYDAIIDTQGLVKSAIIGRWAQGPLAGFARDSAREPLAARAYAHTFSVSRALHAVERNRRLAALALDYSPNVELDYGLQLPAARAAIADAPYAIFLHATSRADKLWPAQHWVALGQELNAQGIKVVLPWGNALEKQRSVRLAGLIPNATVPEALSLLDAATLLAGAVGVVGVDTGLAHLAVALARPTVGIYTTTSPLLTGLYGGRHAVNLGGGTVAEPVTPSVGEVLAAFTNVLQRP